MRGACLTCVWCTRCKSVASTRIPHHDSMRSHVCEMGVCQSTSHRKWREYINAQCFNIVMFIVYSTTILSAPLRWGDGQSQQILLPVSLLKPIWHLQARPLACTMTITTICTSCWKAARSSGCGAQPTHRACTPMVRWSRSTQTAA